MPESLVREFDTSRRQKLFGTLRAVPFGRPLVINLGEKHLQLAIRLAPNRTWKEFEMPRIIFGLSLFICDAATTMVTLLNGWGLIVVIAVSVISSISTLLVSSSLGSLLWPTYFWDTRTIESEHRA